MSEGKSNPEKTVDIISKICTILIPVVLFYFGNKIKQAQDADIRAQQNYNRITTLLKSLSSENALERKLAVEFSKDLASAGNFPIELLSVMDEVSSTDSSNSKQAQAVLNIVGAKARAEENIELEQKVRAVVANSPTRVYMQIPKGDTGTEAGKLMEELKAEGYNVLGIEKVDADKVPKNSEVRYFKEADKEKALGISESIKKKGTKVRVRKIGGYENRISGSQIEIWLN